MKKELKDRQDFIFSETLSELPLQPKTSEEAEKALFGDFDPDKMVDAYEKQLGIKVNEPARPNIRYKNIMLSPGTDDDDSELLNKLYNDVELYHVVSRSTYWTPRGELKMFVEYTENLDVRSERDKAKKLEQLKQQEQQPKETINE